MDLLDLKNDLLNFDEEMNNLKKDYFSIDFSKMDLSSIDVAIITAGNALFDETESYYFEKSLYQMFSLRDIDSNLINRADAKKAIEMALKKAEDFTLPDALFYRVFDRNFAREKDRLRVLTDGEEKTLILKETEDFVVKSYKKIFHLSLLLHFAFIDEEHFYKETMKHALPLTLINGTYASSSGRAWAYDYIRVLVDKTKTNKEETLNTLHAWYQENNCTFLESKMTYNITIFLKLHRLLNKEQKKKLIEQIKVRFSNEIKVLKEKVRGKNEYCEDTSYKIAHFLSEIDKLILLEKDEENEA